MLRIRDHTLKNKGSLQRKLASLAQSWSNLPVPAGGLGIEPLTWFIEQ